MSTQFFLIKTVEVEQPRWFAYVEEPIVGQINLVLRVTVRFEGHAYGLDYRMAQWDGTVNRLGPMDIAHVHREGTPPFLAIVEAAGEAAYKEAKAILVRSFTEHMGAVLLQAVDPEWGR